MSKKKDNISHKAIKYRLYPTDKQKVFFAKTFGCCRKVYNLMLTDKISSYHSTGKLGSFTPAMYKDTYPYLKEVDSLALANVQMNLNAAFQACFDKKRKRKNHFPHMKSKKHCRKSYTTNNQNGTIAIVDNGIKLPKIGVIRAVIHRLPEDSYVLKSATVSQRSDGSYYASVLFECEEVSDSIELTDSIRSNTIGLDYASDCLYVDSNGHKGTNHKYFRESQKKLSKAQRRLSRKIGNKKNQKKSHNYMKQLKKVNKIYRHISNQRLDNLHKISTEIANQYDIVCVEDLNMKSIANKGFGNGKATLDNGYGMFLQLLKYKLKDRGKYLVKVDKWFPSSQICHCCGQRHTVMKDLRIRVMKCDCGLVMDRDENSAINIKKEGLRVLLTQ